MKSRLENLLDYYEEDPHDNFTMYALGLEYVKLNEYQMALKYFSKLKIQQNEYLPLYYHLGKLYEKMQEAHLAGEIYTEGMKLAEKQKENHTHTELKEAYNSLMGIDDDDW